jgi:hypothetical protein
LADNVILNRFGIDLLRRPRRAVIIALSGLLLDGFHGVSVFLAIPSPPLRALFCTSIVPIVLNNTIRLAAAAGGGQI